MKSTFLITAIAVSSTVLTGHTVFASQQEEQVLENVMRTYTEVELVDSQLGLSFDHYEGQLFDPFSVKLSGLIDGEVSRIGVQLSPSGFYNIDFSVRRSDGMESNFSSMDVDFNSMERELHFAEDHNPYPDLLSSVSFSFNPSLELDAASLSRELEALLLGRVLSINSHAPQNGFRGDVLTDEMTVPGHYFMWRDAGEGDLHLASGHEHWTFPVSDGAQEVFFPNNLGVQLGADFSIFSENPIVQFKVRRIEEMVDRIAHTTYEEVVRSRTVFQA